MDLFGDFQKSLTQAFDRPFLAVLLKAVGLTVGLLIAAIIGFTWLLAALLPDQMTLPWIGEVAMLDEVLTIAAIPVLMILSGFLMFPVAAAFVGLFLDDIAGAVEQRHYPDAPPVRPLPLGEAALDAGRFALVFLAVNAAALVFYIVLAPLAPIIFWTLNGYLLGREYFSQVALRRLPPAQAHALRRRHRGRIWAAGILMAIPLSIPLLNLIVPILGVATFTHQFHRLYRKT